MQLQEKLANLPEKPGVYLFRDEHDKILYIGKARILKNRVHSYFQKEPTPNPRLQLLRSKIRDLDYFLCDSEMEALLLEYNLIKEHHPPYNVRFRDDKRFPLIKLVLTDPFPYITIARKREKDGNRYFGPYVSSQAMRQTLKVIRKVFQIRSCTMKITGHERPCLYYHLQECTAPCIAAIQQAEYRKDVDGVIEFLEGKGEKLLSDLKARMEQASRDLHYETAALIRDQIHGLEQVLTKQKVVSEKNRDEDYIGVAWRKEFAAAQVFHVRQGRLVGKDQFFFENAEASREEALAAFIEKYYLDNATIPSKILTSISLDEANLIQELLTKQTEEPVHLEVPQRGEKKKMLDLLEKNALHQLELAILKDSRMRGFTEALEKLQKRFALPSPPFRIEGYDISNLFGQESVGSMVVFIGGKPEKKHYRKFAIQTKSTPDDFAMMEEMLTRRLERLTENEEDESFGATPDLILLDGGRGQLSVGVKVLKKLGKTNIPILSLAKQEEEIYHPTTPTPTKLSRSDAGLKILQHVRDESHRFAVSFHKGKRGKKMTQSVLEEIAGVGKKQAQQLLESFGSLDQIRVADVKEISSVLKCSKALAEKILEAVSS